MKTIVYKDGTRKDVNDNEVFEHLDDPDFSHIEDRKLAQHQQRVVDELKELETKRKALDLFIGGESTYLFSNLSQNEMNLLVLQSETMKQYEMILTMRIATF